MERLTPKRAYRSLRPNRNRTVLTAERFAKYRLTVLGQEDPEYSGDERPRTYGECQAQGLGLTRHCPFVSCSYHLALDVTFRGSIKVQLSAWDPDEQAVDPAVLRQTCALGVAAQNPEGLTLEETGNLLGLTRERVRQVEDKAIARALELAREPLENARENIAP